MFPLFLLHPQTFKFSSLLCCSPSIRQYCLCMSSAILSWLSHKTHILTICCLFVKYLPCKLWWWPSQLCNSLYCMQLLQFSSLQQSQKSLLQNSTFFFFSPWRLFLLLTCLLELKHSKPKLGLGHSKEVRKCSPFQHLDSGQRKVQKLDWNLYQFLLWYRDFNTFLLLSSISPYLQMRHIENFPTVKLEKRERENHQLQLTYISYRKFNSSITFGLVVLSADWLLNSLLASPPK